MSPRSPELDDAPNPRLAVVLIGCYVAVLAVMVLRDSEKIRRLEDQVEGLERERDIARRIEWRDEQAAMREALAQRAGDGA